MGGGEIFAGWGVLNLIALFVSQFLWNSVFVWVIMIVTGIIGQIVYLKIVSDKGKPIIFGEKAISNLWLFLIAVLPLIFYIYPFVFKIYPASAIFPLIALWLSIGLFISGIIVGQMRYKLGAAVFLLTALLLPLFKGQAQLWIYTAAIILGLIVPGLWRKQKAKKETK